MTEIKDLTNTQIIEDIEHYLKRAQIQSPPFLDDLYYIINSYIIELKEREVLQ